VTCLQRFLDPASVSLKICGVTRHRDAAQLITLGVHALGINFWSGSKRYLPPADAAWLLEIAGKILRVGVFVNAPVELPLRLMGDGLLDVIQLHGDEAPADAEAYRSANIPFIKAIGVTTRADLVHAGSYGAAAILLDAHAPGIYGGTGEVFDWNVAKVFGEQHPGLPLILAGGIVPDNAAVAASHVSPAALDVASGAELSPGIKDFSKVQALLAALQIETGR